MDFIEIITKLTRNPHNVTILIKGKQRHILGMVKLTTINFPDNPYIKITFTDGSFLLLMLNDKEAYFSETIIGHIKEIKDEHIGVDQAINYNGKKYELGNKNDYQYVLKWYKGEFGDVEGEARFSDYFPIKGTKEFLSLGWLAYNNQRADINPVLISLDQIQIT